VNLFLDKLRQRFVQTGKTCEMTDWISFCEHTVLPFSTH
jgi:hypothetical protein